MIELRKVFFFRLPLLMACPPKILEGGTLREIQPFLKDEVLEESSARETIIRGIVYLFVGFWKNIPRHKTPQSISISLGDHFGP